MADNDLRGQMIKKLEILSKYQKIEQVIAKESDKMEETINRFHETQKANKIKESLKNKK